MTELTNWSMRAGRGNEEIHGWVYQQTIGGQISRTVIPTTNEEIAFAIARSKPGLIWLRAYTIENGIKVVLA